MVAVAERKKLVNPTFGQRLRASREAKDLTQKALGELAGLHPHAITRLERGQREPGWETVVRLADALGVSTDEFRAPKPGEPPCEPSA